MPVLVALSLAVLVSAILGLLAEELIHWPLSKKNASTEVNLIASLGAYLLLIQVIAIIWGNDTQVLRISSDQIYSMFSITLAKAQLLGPVFTLIATALLLTWLIISKRGLELRALADNPILLSLFGHNVRILRRWVFVLSAVIASVASIALAWDVGFDAHGGLRAVLLGMVAMIIGGSNNYVGPFVGGLVLGLLRAEVVWLGSARYEDAVTFLLLALFLFFRPQGIFGENKRLEESN